MMKIKPSLTVNRQQVAMDGIELLDNDDTSKSVEKQTKKPFEFCEISCVYI